MPASPRTYKILVVEDNPGDAHLIEEAFRECGRRCDLHFTDSLREAKQVIENDSFDLIISDMGVRNGETEEFIRGIRSGKNSRSVPVIVLSGALNPRPAYEAGANAFISKSMDMDDFFKKIRDLMHFWTDIAELPPK